MRKSALIVKYFIFIFLLGSNTNTYAFDLNNLFKNLSKNNSPTFIQPDTQDQNGNLNYSSGSIISFLCRRNADPLEWMHDASDANIKSIKKDVAVDFNKGTTDTQNIIFMNRLDGKKWARDLIWYRNGFNSSKIQRLFENFIVDGLRRLEIAAKIKYAISNDDLDEIEQNDAKFAYSLILAHFNGVHTKQAYQERLLMDAYENFSLGAIYVVGHRLFFGIDGVRQNIPKAANVLSNPDDWKNQDGNEWQNIVKLFHIVAVDPRNPYHERNRRYAAQALKIKADLKRQIASNSGSTLRRDTEKLVRIQMQAGLLLLEAFDFAKEQAEIKKRFQDLVNQADENQQVIRKLVRISTAAADLVERKISNATHELDPIGKEKLKRARGMNRYVIAQLGKTTLSFFNNFGSLSDTVAVAPAMDKGLKTACKLHHALTDYAAKKEIPVNNGIINAEEANMKIFDQ